MKLTFVLCLVAFLQVSAASYAQKITLNVKGVSFDQLLDDLEKQSGYHFLYDNELISHVSPVNVEVKDLPFKDVLNLCFNNKPFKYLIKDKNVIITPILNDPKPSVQTSSVSGVVTDDKNQPLPGVSIRIKGTKMGVTTDKDGKFTSPDLEADAVLVISFVGYETKEVAVNGQKYIAISLTVGQDKLNEVVVVGYGTQKRKTLTGSIATVKSAELTAAPIASITNALGGRLPGLITQQLSGQPGYDAAGISIRGFGNALIIIDGVESNINNIDPNQVESVSILKDASAAIYGSRAGNGVVLITTKRGNNSKPTFQFNSSYTLQGVTDMLKPVSAGQYAELKSEAWLQSGQPTTNVPFTPDQIAKYYQGTDPDYPNTNWYKVLVRPEAPETENNVSVRGGSDQIKYYGFIGYVNQQSMFKTNGGSYGRYNVQSNIDAKINKDLSMQFDISSVIEKRNFPYRPEVAGQNTVWQDLWDTLPIYPATLPDPTKVSYANGGGTGGAQVTSNSAIAGYDDLNSQNLKGTLSLNYNLPFVKGLSAKILGNYLHDYGMEKNFVRPANFYTYDYGSKTYTLQGTLNPEAALSLTNSEDQTLTSQASLNYDNTFDNGKHHVTVLALYEAITYSSDYTLAGRTNYLTPAIDQLFAGNAAYQIANGSATESGRESYVGRVNYSYLGRYLFESTFRADASAVFPPGKQWGYFPSVSAGWLLSQEKFMEKASGFIDELKLRASYGRSGNDNVGNFQYLSGYQYGGSYLIGGNPQQGLLSTGLANPNLTWENITIYNAGLDASFFKRKLYGEFDVFYRNRTGLLASPTLTLPTTFGSALPLENLNSQNDRGFELKVGTTGNAGDFSWDVSANISWSRSKWEHYDEPNYTDPDQARISKLSGQWTDNVYGYKSAGLFTSQAQIDALKFDEDGQNNKSLRPGDIRYVDVNGDGVLNYKDEINIGLGTVPHWFGGFNTILKYRNFDMAALFQGAFGNYTNVILTQGLVPPTAVYDLRWTPANDNGSALVPRLGGAATNSLPSNYYYKNASYIRLKTFTLGYTLPKNVLNSMGFSQLRLYVAGTNLLTFDGLKKYGVDPEAPSGNQGYYYPQQRTLSVGINASF